MITWSNLLLLVVIFIPYSLLMTFIPYLTRRTESFGVSITEELYHLPQLQRLRKQYSLLVGTVSCVIIVSIIVLTSMLEAEAWAVALTVHMLGLMFVSFIVYLIFNNMMKKLKAQHKWINPEQERIVVSSSFRSLRLAYSPLWFVPHGIVVIATVVIGLFYYDQFPNEIVMQYDMSGDPTRVVGKSYQTVLWPAALQVFIISLQGLIYYSIIRSKQQIDASKPNESLQRSVLFRRFWSAYILATSFLLVVIFLFIQLNFLLGFEPKVLAGVIMSAVGIMVVTSFWLSFKTGQGGSRLKVPGEGSTGDVNVDDDAHWKLGRIYYNPNDPSIFVEKRFGIGWTVNFGHPISWVILIGVIVVPILLSIFGE